MGKKPLVSIVIPAYNEESCIGECLRSLKKQSYKNFELIVVDDGSEDRTKEIVKGYKVKLIENKHRGPGLSRNSGVEKARGEIIVFIDSDMTFHEDYIKNLIVPILLDKGGKIVGTTHELEIVKNIDNVWSACWGRFRVKKEEAGNVKIFRAIKKDRFLEMGGFDARYGYADDQTFWFKYKVKPEVARNTICYHQNPKTLKEIYRQSRWIGSSSLMSWLDVPFINILFIAFLYLLSPLSILLLSIRQAIKVEKLRLLIPYMFIFMTARYFGTLAGFMRRVFLRMNVR